LKQQRWGLTMAGCSVRYRRRITLFERFEMRSRVAGLDDRFIYLEQSLWKRNGECAGHILYRSAITSRDGIVPPARVMEISGLTFPKTELPHWVQAWVDADAHRPWPPMQDNHP
ncbi:MAG: acyl-CoA thioesterase, partial [Pseudomonadota bacterium]